MRDDGQTRQTAESDGHADVGPCADEDLHALLLIEIVDFAFLRRSFGLAQAELLAPSIAERVAAVLPDASVTIVGRALIEVGFTLRDPDELNRAVTKLHQSVERPVMVERRPCQLRLRIGAAAVCAGAVDEVALVEAAEEALAHAQPGGGGGSIGAVITPTTAATDAAIGRELYRAVNLDELFLQYQPKLHLRRQEITSVEALIRWRHPERGLVLPNDFIPAAERSGAIKAMTLWTLRQVVADQRAILRNGQDLPVFVNIAGVLLSDAGFVAAAIELVRESGAKLGFEITETSVIREPEVAIEHLKQLADIGVTIAIDDYGAGLSSLAYLKQLPARELKIDKLFVTQLSSSHRDPLIVRSTIDLAHALEMDVVAEGVETPISLALLSVMGCDMVQGFLISRPLVLEGLLAFLHEERHRQLLEQSGSPLQRLAAVRARA